MQATPAHPGNAGAADRAVRGYAAAFGALVAVTFCLIVLGALVRAHEAGLACPDWPLCFGELVPEMDLKVAFEWSHRVLAGSVALGFATLATLVFRSGSGTHETARWIVLAAGLLVVQIVLGALTVWELLASWTVTSHLITGNAFALSLLFVAASLWDARAGRPRRARAALGVRAALVVAAVVLFLQMVLGGLVSSGFAGMACPEWPACNGGVWFPSWQGSVGLHLLHRWNGTLLAGLVPVVAWIIRGAPGVRGLMLLAAGVAVLQAMVGIVNVLLAIPVEVTGLHSALAAVLVLTIGAATRAAWVPTADPASG